MVNWTRYATYGIGLAGLIVAVFAVNDANAALALGGGLGGAVALGWYQHAKDTLEHDERYMAINYRAGYVAFWTVYWFLFVFAMSGIGGSESGGTTSHLPVEAYTVVLIAWVLGTVVMFGSKAWYKRQF